MAPIAKPKVQLQKTFLREWRRSNNFSQADAARELRISRPLLSQIENAKSPYTQRLIESAAQLYKCTPAEILGGPGVVNFEILRQSIKAVDEDCQATSKAASPQERAHMIINYYRESLRAISSIDSVR